MESRITARWEGRGRSGRTKQKVKELMYMDYSVLIAVGRRYKRTKW